MKVEDSTKASQTDSPESNTMVSEVVTPIHIQEIISKWTGTPLNRFSRTDKERLLHLDERLCKRVVGQDKAIKDVYDCILQSLADLFHPNQPTGSFLLLGLTRVRKTLYSELYDGDDERHIVRIDMSKYIEQHSLA
jgi:ATP-dependent Clp protease ATP-binding subunit ClpB